MPPVINGYRPNAPWISEPGCWARRDHTRDDTVQACEQPSTTDIGLCRLHHRLLTTTTTDQERTT